MRDMKKLMQTGLEQINDYDNLHLSEIYQIYQYAKTPSDRQDAIWAAMSISYYSGYAAGLRRGKKLSKKASGTL